MGIHKGLKTEERKWTVLFWGIVLFLILSTLNCSVQIKECNIKAGRKIERYTCWEGTTWLSPAAWHGERLRLSYLRCILARGGKQQGDSDLTLLIRLCVPRDEGTDCWKRDAGHGGHRPCCPHHPAMTRPAAVRWQASPKELTVQSTICQNHKKLCFLLLGCIYFSLFKKWIFFFF